MTKAEVFNDVFREDAAELFLKPDNELLEWLESEYNIEPMEGMLIEDKILIDAKSLKSMMEEIQDMIICGELDRSGERAVYKILDALIDNIVESNGVVEK